MTALNKQALRETNSKPVKRIDIGIDEYTWLPIEKACPEGKYVLHSDYLSLLDELESAEKHIAEQSEIVAAAEKLVRCKGRYHSELNYRALAKLFGVTTPDLPPLEHENVHYADAAEMEIAALRQRINELEARTVTLPEPFKLAKSSSGLTYYYADEVDAAIQAAGIGVKGE